MLALLLAWGGPVAAATISGRVTDERGQPIAGVDLDFFVVATAQEESVNNDMTDLNGNYSVIVNNEVYDVFYDPQPGARLAGHVQENVNLNVNQTVDVVLKDAWYVSGQVVRAGSGGPILNVDLDFRDLQAGAKIYTPRDNTDPNGRYSVGVPKGIYEVIFDGPAPLQQTDPRFAPIHLEEISVTGDGDFSLPTVTMSVGFAVSGEVLDQKGDGVVAADLDFFDASTGQKIFLSHDNTDARARYTTIVPPGTYRIGIDPPQASLSAAKLKPAVTIAADTNLGTDVLQDGLAVTGFVRDPDGNPLRQVDLDFTLSSTGASVPTAWDKTDGVGRFSVRAPADTYNIAFRSQVNTLVDPAARTGITVSFDRSLSDTILPFHDADGDSVADAHDRCPLGPDQGQADFDADGAGDICDNCPFASNARQFDNDGDGAGDECDEDDDADGVPDAGDPDRDGDGAADALDNCPQRFNPDQLDRDADGAGDACDADDGEVEDLRALGPSAFRWAPEAGAATYQVYRLPLAWLSKLDYGVCFRDDLRAVLFLDSQPLPSGGAFTYLVTSRPPSGVEGSLGRRGDGAERPNLRPCP